MIVPGVRFLSRLFVETGSPRLIVAHPSSIPRHFFGLPIRHTRPRCISENVSLDYLLPLLCKKETLCRTSGELVVYSSEGSGIDVEIYLIGSVRA